MTTIKSLVSAAKEMKDKGMSEKEIANELHISLNTVRWLLTHGVSADEAKPSDIRIGWRSIGIYPTRIRLISEIMSDIILEEMEKKARGIDAVVAIAINGIPFASFIAEELGVEMIVYRPQPDGSGGIFSSNYAAVRDKHVAIIDDVLGTGQTIKGAIAELKKAGAIPELIVVLVNKSPANEIDDVPLRGLVRAILLSEME